MRGTLLRDFFSPQPFPRTFRGGGAKVCPQLNLNFFSGSRGAKKKMTKVYTFWDKSNFFPRKRPAKGALGILPLFWKKSYFQGPGDGRRPKGLYIFSSKQRIFWGYFLLRPTTKKQNLNSLVFPKKGKFKISGNSVMWGIHLGGRFAFLTKGRV